MKTLLYRGQAYAPHHTAAPKQCVELTYRREQYSTCREAAAHGVKCTMTYRGISFTK